MMDISTVETAFLSKFSFTYTKERHSILFLVKKEHIERIFLCSSLMYKL